jgi:hypothetical protein
MNNVSTKLGKLFLKSHTIAEIQLKSRVFSWFLDRCLATHQLTKVANHMSSTWEGPPPMLAIFKKMFGSFAAGHIIKQNDFSMLQSYFLQKV